MKLAEYLAVLRRRWLTLAVVVLAGLAVAVLVTLAMPTRYTATTRLFFGVQSGGSATDLSQGSTFAEKQMSSYAQVAVSPLVLTRVIRDLDLPATPRELAESVIVTVPTDTVILEIAVIDQDPERAAKISNSIGRVLASVAADLSPARPDGTESVRATTLAPAVVPTQPSSPNVLRNIALGAVVGLLLGVGAALAREALDTKLRNEGDVRATTDVPLLGVVPFDPAAPEHRVVMSDREGGGRAEAVRRLRTNLQFVGADGHPGVVVVSSSVPEEGKTTTAINLSAALADGGLSVLLVDADLRRPSVADYLGLEGRAGLTSVLIGRADLRDVVQRLGQRSLDVLAAGPVPPNPSELLGSAVMRELIATARAAYDIVIVDSPPLLPVTDPAILGRLADGTIVVVGADRAHRPQLLGGLDALRGVDAKVLGIVLNKVSPRASGASSYRYGYPTHSSEPAGIDRHHHHDHDHGPEPREGQPVAASAEPATAADGSAAGAVGQWPPRHRDQSRAEPGRAMIDRPGAAEPWKPSLPA